MFLDAKHMLSSILPVIQPNITNETLNLIMACYAIFLNSGHTVTQCRIKAKTIEKYLLAAATFIAQFDHIPGRDARKLPNMQSLSPIVKKVLDSITKFETIPDKREPYTLAMQHALSKKITNPRNDDILTVLYQWFAVCLQGGNRQAEWCQSRKSKNLTIYDLNPKNESQAFTPNDIQFLGSRKDLIPIAEALTDRVRVHHVRICYRWQKNNNHGEKKTYTRNTINPECDSVEHLLNIVDRHSRLLGPTALNRPLAIYKTKQGVTQYVTNKIATETMRTLARDLYALTTTAESNKWSCHSLRVGACCILWAMGYPAEFIQHALRWRSEAWKDYIRDLLIHSSQHNKAISDASLLPAF